MHDATTGRARRRGRTGLFEADIADSKPGEPPSSWDTLSVVL